MAANPPTDTVTFLFTDIEGSTKLALEQPTQWDALQERHHAILRSTMDVHNGYVFNIIGDAFCVAFDSAGEALQAALDAQRRLQTEAWGETPIKVRMGLHTGAAERREDGYHGYLTLALAQRVMSAAFGGQILLTSSTAQLLGGNLTGGVSLRDMSEHRLKGFNETQHLWQTVAPDLWQDFPRLPTLKRVPTNLPVQTTNLVGREKEMEESAELLTSARLLTLIGSGGTGKTRLSLHVAERVQDGFRDGVWWIELAPVSDPNLLVSSVMTVLGVQEESGSPLLTTLTDWLRDKELLLVLDNCEHLVQTCAEFAHIILQSSHGPRLLATSREPLGVTGETTYRVPSLRIPESPDNAEPDRIMQCASVQLFVERSGQAMRSFRLTQENAAAVAQICCRLDGIPLAIELAAARVSALSVEQIAARLDDRFRLLTRGGRTSLPRHQTLRAMIDWSYDLLSRSEQMLLERLSVLSGGWTLESMEQVCAEEAEGSDVIALLANLVDKSLVILDETEEGLRYRLLETTRQYAQEKLQAKGQEAAVRDRHLSHFLALAETAETNLRGASQLVWLNRLERELNNLRGALEWSQTNNRLADGLRLATALQWFWYLRSLLSEGYHWLRRTLHREDAATLPLALRAGALFRLAHLAHYLGDPIPQRTALLEESLEMNRSLDSSEGCCYTLIMMAWITQEAEKAEALYAEALEYARRSDNPWMAPATLMNMADLMVDLGQYDRALKDLDESTTQFRALGDRWGIAWSLLSTANAKNQMGQSHGTDDLLTESAKLFGDLKFKVGVRVVVVTQAELEFKKGNFERSTTLFEENLSLATEMGLRNSIASGLLYLGNSVYRLGNYQLAASHISDSLISFREQGLLSQIPACLASMAQVIAALGKPERAARLFSAAETQRKSLGRPFITSELDAKMDGLEAVRQRLGAADFARAFAEGQRMTLEQAIGLALQKDDS